MLVRVESVFEFPSNGILYFLGHGFIDHRWLDSPFLRLDFRVQLFLNSDDLLDCLMAEIQSLDHHLFGDFIGATFHHHDAIFHSGNGQIEPAVFQFGIGGIEIVTAIDEPDPYCSDGMGKWNTRCVQSRRRANDGMHRGIDVTVG